MDTRVHRPLEVIAFNANGNGRHHFELSKLLQAQLIDVALLLDTHLQLHKRLSIQT